MNPKNLEAPPVDGHEARTGQELLAAELNVTRHLQRVSLEIVRGGDMGPFYDRLLDAAIAIMRSDFASVQMRDIRTGDLLLLSHRNFHPDSAAFWARVRGGTGTTCGQALETSARCIVTDVETCEWVLGTEDHVMYRRSGIRSVQSTPLLARDGTLIGMISTHWRAPHVPSEGDLRLFDILARQAADAIERQQAEEALREGDRRKDEFLATLAHELRNPLAPIRNSLGILRVGGLDRPTSERILDIMDRQVSHMVRLVDDLLEVSRITRGTIELRREMTDVSTVVRSAIETSRPLLEVGRHDLEVALPTEPLYLEADPVRLAQVLANLLNNSARYTEEGGRIRLTASREGSEVVLSVQDNGMGISNEVLPKVFDMFLQGDRTYSRSQGGLGIGLTLVRRLVEMHGGTVDARSGGAGQGSEFIVRLPLPPEQPKARDLQAAGARMAIDSRRVLIVDDNADAAESLGVLLKFLGADVLTAADGDLALEALQTYKPSVVFLDIGLPRMDGYEVARRARKTPEGTSATLVALTGWGQEDDRKRSREAGIDHHLVKPVDISALQAIFASLS